jgi:hypothetical protein
MHMDQLQTLRSLQNETCLSWPSVVMIVCHDVSNFRAFVGLDTNGQRPLRLPSYGSVSPNIEHHNIKKVAISTKTHHDHLMGARKPLQRRHVQNSTRSGGWKLLQGRVEVAESNLTLDTTQYHISFV